MRCIEEWRGMALGNFCLMGSIVGVLFYRYKLTNIIIIILSNNLDQQRFLIKFSYFFSFDN